MNCEDYDLVEVVNDDNSKIYITALVLDPESDVSDKRLSIKAETLLDVVTPLADGIKSRLAAASPDEVSVTIKLGVGIQSGKAVAIIADGKIDGSIEVVAKWANLH
ncbi:CU044_2847 family protein [Gordonia otitidis]|uniref:Trypsin-co-occurring domain-containing protein n=1 Tax=Gordonia otitidis (strain DSM 44809 / CCUG 52243 / JCM 12355 / NBRC 100426 / IFM 10032) TaxID=1108044 RepID=H5TTL0_GORO1|nr:CU044_2847 family protein [Gordonia otitidis]GAB36818.1 hypothetical protein GOOTI_239_00650 [Gordonia otitidis NBRC 100426]